MLDYNYVFRVFLYRMDAQLVVHPAPAYLLQCMREERWRMVAQVGYNRIAVQSAYRAVGQPYSRPTVLSAIVIYDCKLYKL